jgi:hypothetical protein
MSAVRMAGELVAAVRAASIAAARTRARAEAREKRKRGVLFAAVATRNRRFGR